MIGVSPASAQKARMNEPMINCPICSLAWDAVGLLAEASTIAGVGERGFSIYLPCD
jgi:hypothetical protein